MAAYKIVMIKKLGHIFIALLLLISTTGMTVRLHYCNNRLYDVGIFSNAANCCMDVVHEHSQEAGHHQHKNKNNQDCNSESHQKNDCENDTVKVETVGNYVLSAFDFDFNSISFLNLFLSTSVVINLYNPQDISTVEIPSWNISPPKIQVLLSLLQTYLL